MKYIKNTAKTWMHMDKSNIYTPAPRRGRGYTVLPLSICPSVLPSVQDIFRRIFLIFGHKHHIGIPYCG